MRNKISLYFSILIIALSLESCVKNVDKFPFNSIETSQSFLTLKDAKAWNVGLYARLRGNLYGSFMFIQDVQADQLNATLDYGNRNGNPHRWGQSFLADDGALSGPWNAFYTAIVNINVGIDGFEKIPTANATEKAELDRYKGDNYLARAYYYSQLITRFAKAYNPSTASTDLGVPIVLTYDLNGKPARATVKAVYDQIISDIEKARTLLTAVPGAQGSSKFTIHSVNALDARVKLEMQNWAGAIAAADAVISSGTYPLITTSTELNNMWKSDFGKEVINQAFVSKPNELPNVNSIYLGLIPANGKFTPDFVPSQWVVDAYADADLRKSVYFERKLVSIQGVDYPNVWLVNKYPGNSLLFTAATTNYAHAPKIFRIAELYLIVAEAGARAGGASEATALTRLNNLRVARGLTALTGVAGSALFQAVKEERFRELAFEGTRLWDLKRWSEGFSRRQPQNTSFILTGSNYDVLTIPATEDKFIWGIPTRDLTTNLNLVQNKGW
jgi:starch-binding outer membrane protein, SusD/RagB family